MSADRKLAREHREVILITGASSGLGAGMAREFARRGADLALCARRLDRLERLTAEIQAQRPETRIEVARLDVTDHQAVFTCFRAFREAFGRLDRVIVNAGTGSGAPVGKGGAARNLEIVGTNFTAALVQAEAAMEIFRDQGFGHLVFMSSISALRGLRGSLTVYSACKAGLATLAEGIRADMLRKPGIKITTLYPGYIRTEMNEQAANLPFIIDAVRGCRLLVDAIERKPATAIVPRWPWSAIGPAMRWLPLSVLARIQ